MRALFSIAWRSAWNRRFTLALTVFSIALSTFLLLGVERIRTELRQNFAAAVSGTDLIVGARTGSTQLLLYSVFRIGAATNNMQWKSVQALAAHPGVDWVVPLSLGDSHRGFAVLATTPTYFERFRYGNRQPLALREGRAFAELFDAVVGAEVGSSAITTSGWPIKARAAATRCCWPTDSCMAWRCHRLLSRPIRASSSRACAGAEPSCVACAMRRPEKRHGSSTLSSTLR